jgi:type VI protein secretion system component Hcp
MAQVVGYLEIPGERGESRDPGHLGWIELMELKVQATGQGGHGSVTCVKELDYASPQLALSCAAGRSFDCQIDAVQNGRVSAHYALKAAIVASVHPGPRTTGIPLERITLDCATIDVQLR